MTSRDRKTRNGPVELACELDNQLRAGRLAEDILEINGEQESQPSSLFDLSEAERRDLKAAKAALYFLNRVRIDLDRQATQFDSANPFCDNRHSTIKNLETLNDGPGDDFEFTKLGRFEIVEPIGQGGFAKVFLARDPLLDRKVAIKILQAHALLEDESRNRFEREARSAAMLSHPAILPVYETGIVGPVTFIVSEYCPGSNLSEWFVRSGRKTDLRTAAEIVARLAEAAQHAHQRGVIHRDLKPANVLVQDGEGPLAKRLRVADFGLAKQLECNDDMTITTDGAVVGTPAYMSPEQAHGSTTVDGSTDIFSLGVILYELLTGTLPFKKTSHLSTLNAIANQVPLPLRKINRNIPRDLEAICLKCLNKRPEDRYAEAFLLADDLNAWLGGRPIAARRATRKERLVRWVRREPALAAAVAFAFFSLAGGLVLTGWQWQTARANLVESNVQRDRALKNIHRIQTTVESVLDKYSDSLDENLYLDPGHRRLVNEMVGIHKELIDEEAHALQITDATIDSYAKIARLNRKLAQYQEARDICQQARRLGELAISNNPSSESQLRFALVNINVEEICLALNFGQNEQAEQLARDALAVMEKFGPQQPAAAAEYLWLTLDRHLGYALHAQEKFDEMVPYMERSLQHATELLALAPTQQTYQSIFGTSLQDVAAGYRSVGRWDEAEHHFEMALSHFETLAAKTGASGDYRLQLGYLRLDLAESYALNKRFEEAEAKFVAARSVLESLVADDPADIDAYNRLVHSILREAMFREVIGEYDAARTLHERGLQMGDQVALDVMKARYQMYFRVGLAALLINHFEVESNDLALDCQIETLLDQATEIGEVATITFPREPSLTEQLAEAYRHKGRILYFRGQVEDALAVFLRAAEISIRYLGEVPGQQSARNLAMQRAKYAAKLATELNRYGTARSILLELAEAAPNEVEIQLQSARYLCRLAGIVQQTSHAPDEISEIETIALSKLARAFELGFNDRELLKQQAVWNPVRDLEKFRKLVEPE